MVNGEELNDARSHRDALWNLVKLTHVQAESIPEDQASDFEEELENFAGSFEPAMTRTDELADQRFDHADVAGRIAEIKRKIGEQETLFEQVQEGEAKLVEEGEQLQAEWTTSGPQLLLIRWQQTMLEWLEARE